MFQPKGKIRARRFLAHLKTLVPNAHAELVVEYNMSQRDLVIKFLEDSNDFVENNEWGVGIEILLENLYEVDFKIDEEGMKLLKDALDFCNYNYDDWEHLGEIKK